MNLNSHDISLLKQLLLRGIRESQIENYLKKTTLLVREFPRDSTVINRGKNFHWLLILTRGEAVSEISSYSGKLIKIDYLKPPEIVAPACLFVEKYEIPVTIRTITNCRFIYIPKSEIQNWLSQNSPFGGEFSKNMLRIISKKAINLSKRISFLTLHTIEEKFISYLLSLSPENIAEDTGMRIKDKQITVTLSISIEELAAYFGVERPSLSRAIGRLEKRGVITRAKKRGKEGYIFTLKLPYMGSL